MIAGGQLRPPILTIQVVPAGMDLIIGALRKLPHEQVDDLVQELWAQYKAEMNKAAARVLTEPAVDSDGGTAD